MPKEPHPIDLHVGRRLKLARLLQGVSQEHLAASLGMTYQQVQKYERGSNRVSSSRLAEIAGLLQVPITFFFGDDELTGLSLEVEPDQPVGLAEGAQPFAMNGAPVAPRGLVIDRREALEMLRAFNRIADVEVRRRLLELSKALADLDYVEAQD